MFDGGSPDRVMTLRAGAARTARSEEPETTWILLEVSVRAGAPLVASPMATNPTRIRAARPTTIMAGRMLKPA